MSKKGVAASQPAKTQEPAKKAGFDPKAYAKNGVSEE
jgi:hypothetical protein